MHAFLFIVPVIYSKQRRRNPKAHDMLEAQLKAPKPERRKRGKVDKALLYISYTATTLRYAPPHKHSSAPLC